MSTLTDHSRICPPSHRSYRCISEGTPNTWKHLTVPQEVHASPPYLHSYILDMHLYKKDLLSPYAGMVTCGINPHSWALPQWYWHATKRRTERDGNIYFCQFPLFCLSWATSTVWWQVTPADAMKAIIISLTTVEARNMYILVTCSMPPFSAVWIAEPAADFANRASVCLPTRIIMGFISASLCWLYRRKPNQR